MGKGVVERRLNSSWESAEDLLSRYATLGIPHFQRGLVWGSDSVALLLESLFWKTPCGSVILWEPSDPGEQGIPLARERQLRHLIIDGQQRIRSLWSVFGSSAPEPGDDKHLSDGESEQVPRIWCVDLTHIPSLAPAFGPPSRYSIFRLVGDPAHPKARRWKAVVPLDWLRNGEHALIDAHVTAHDGSMAADTLAQSDLPDHLRAMTSEPLFAVRILEETTERNRLAEVVAVYNRINSAGKRVEAEERAYAALIAYAPDARHWLRDLFAAIHGAEEPKDASRLRDDALRRRKESAFGFKLFVRTFVQVAAYHMGYSLGSSGFSFDLLESEGFHRHLADPKNAGKVAEMRESTKQVLVFVRGVLRDDLHCDDLRMLPEASSLWPVIQLLTRFPALMDESSPGRAAVAGLMLRLYLAAREHPELLRLVGVVNRSHTARECLGELARSLGIGEIEKRLGAGLRQSRSLQDRHLLLLYWLLRRKLCVRDFSHENLKAAGRTVPEHPELPICEGSKPEKQHLVPYSRLAQTYELSGRDRVSTHRVNDIGNLTYISRWLNGFENGLGADPVDLSLEPEDNKQAHFLARAEDIDVEGAFRAALSESTREAYERFCDVRRALIERAFVDWLQATEGWAASLDDAARIDPAEMHFLVTDGERVRRMGYPDLITDAVLDCLGTGRLRRVNRGKELGQREVFGVRRSAGGRSYRSKLHLLQDRIVIEPIEPGERKRLGATLAPLVPIATPGSAPAGWVVGWAAGSCARIGADALRIVAAGE